MDREFDRKVVDWLNDHKPEMYRDIDRLLSIESVTGEPQPDAPFGAQVKEALDCILDICQQAGMVTRNIDGMVGEATLGVGSQTLGVLTHVDVVPAGTGWRVKDYGLTVEDGHLYGRGIIDDKGPAVASVYALRAAMAAGATFHRKLVFIFGGDEEQGMKCVTHYLKSNKAPDMAWSPDAGFPVIHCEKTIAHAALLADVGAGSLLTGIRGGTRTNVVPNRAEALLRDQPLLDEPLPPGVGLDFTDGQWRMLATGRQAHASTPDAGSNAIVALLDGLRRVLPEGDPARDAAEGLWRCCAATDGAGLRVDCRDHVSGALTLNLGVIDMADGVIRAKLDMRHPVEVDVQKTIYTALPAAAAANGVRAVDMEHDQGFNLPKDHMLVKTLTDLYNDITGDRAEPVAIGGGTYARKLPCAVAYGMMFADDEECAHMVNEHISEEHFLQAVRIYAHAFRELAQ